MNMSQNMDAHSPDAIHTVAINERFGCHMHVRYWHVSKRCGGLHARVSFGHLPVRAVDPL